MLASRSPVRAQSHMIAAGHTLAAQAGLAILEEGGNAVDAGVAAALTLGVVQSDLVGVAGVAPIMVRTPDGRVETISGVGRWPRAADIDTFIRRHGGHVPRGLLSTIVPAAPDAFLTALERWGTLSFAEVAAAAARCARDGFVMHELMAQSIRTEQADYAEWPSTRALFLPKGRPPEVGEVFVQAELAAVLDYMADEERAAAGGGRAAGLAAARDAFYRRDVADAIVRFHAAEGGWMTARDLAEFRVGVEPPVAGRFGRHTVYACGVWCQGPVLLQTLNLLDAGELATFGHNSAGYIHRLAEATKLAFADRETYYGDPDFVDVPLDRLLSADYSAAQRARIRDDAVIDGAGLWPVGAVVDGPGSALDTSYACVVDRDGLAFSCTPSDGSTTTPVIPGLGLCVSGRGSQSWAVPGHPSSVAPWKRPRLTPNPAIAVDDSGRVMPFGTPGADVQSQAMVQVLLNRAVFGMDLQAAVEAPRFALYGYPQSFEPHESGPDTLRLESRIDRAVVDRLAALGHRVEDWPATTWKAGAVCAIETDPANGALQAGADPRRPCAALGF